MTRESYNLNAEMNMVMNERFNVSGAMLVKLFGRPEAEAEHFDAKAARVRDIGIDQALYARLFFVALTLTASLATAFAYGFGGVRGGERDHRWSAPSSPSPPTWPASTRPSPSSPTSTST